MLWRTVFIWADFTILPLIFQISSFWVPRCFAPEFYPDNTSPARSRRNLLVFSVGFPKGILFLVYIRGRKVRGIGGLRRSYQPGAVLVHSGFSTQAAYLPVP